MKKNTWIYYWSRASIVFITLAALVSVFAETGNKKRIKFQWPVPQKYDRQISSTFGESRLDHFHAGVDIPGENLPVIPVSKGRLLYYTEGYHRPGEIPFGGGKTVVIDHKEFLTGYMHMKTLSTSINRPQNPGSPQIISAETIIGSTGNTGHSAGAHLHFFIYDTSKKRMYNPLLVLPDGWYQDESSPETQQFAVKLPEELVRVNPERKIILTEDYPFFAHIYDRGRGKERWGVYYLKAYKKEGSDPVQQVKFDYITLNNNKWVTSNNLTFEQVYHHGYYLLGKGFRDSGQIILEAGGLKGPGIRSLIPLKVRTKK